MTKDRLLRFDDVSDQRLQALIRKTEADSAAEVIKNALRLYEGMIEMTEAGKRWIVKDANGNLQPFNPWK